MLGPRISQARPVSVVAHDRKDHFAPPFVAGAAICPAKQAPFIGPDPTHSIIPKQEGFGTHYEYLLRDTVLHERGVRGPSSEGLIKAGLRE